MLNLVAVSPFFNSTAIYPEVFIILVIITSVSVRNSFNSYSIGFTDTAGVADWRSSIMVQKKNERVSIYIKLYFSLKCYTVQNLKYKQLPIPKRLFSLLLSW